jgi:iron complex outermembrane receptor protein
MTYSKNFAAALAASVCLVAIATPASAQTRVYNIPAGSLKSALDAYARQSGRQVIYKSDEVRSARSPGAKGALSADAALRALLAGTGFTVRNDASGAVAIVRSAGDPTAADANSAAFATSGPQDPASQERERVKDEEIVVTGSNIRGSKPGASPLKVYTKTDIEQTGATSVTDFLRVMPENFAAGLPLASQQRSGATVSGFSQTGSNNYHAASINLHGLGPEATLTLINGHRVSPAGGGDYVDVSLIPFSAIDRIEVMPDAASATYGADAVAGVVNFILRDDYEGFESRFSHSSADDGAAQFTVSQAAGTSWNSGNALIAYEYGSVTELLAKDRPFTSGLRPLLALVAPSKRHSVFFAGSQRLFPDTRLMADALYSHRTTNNPNYSGTTPSILRSNVEQYGGTVTLIQGLGSRWEVRTVGSAYRTAQRLQRLTPTLTAPSFENYELYSGTAKADGPLFAIAGGDVKLAVGGELRYESTYSTQLATANAGDATRDRRVLSVFGETLVPVFSADNAVPGIAELTLSASARYDRYSDFGDAVSPKVGLVWAPTSFARFRISYGRAYRPPFLRQLAPSPLAYAMSFPNSADPDGMTNTLVNAAQGSATLGPQTSRSLTVGGELRFGRFRVGGGYFRTLFEDRIASPTVPGGIVNLYANLNTLSSFVTFNPPLADVQALFNSPGFLSDSTGGGPTAIEALYDNRVRNVAYSFEDGIEGSASWSGPFAGGQLSTSISATYLFRINYQLVKEAPVLRLVGIYGQPSKLKANGFVSWSTGPFSTSVNVGFVGAYRSPYFTPAPRIASWATVGVQVGFDFGKLGLSPFSGLSLSLSVQNLLDQDPPYVNTIAVAPNEPGFDPFNASAVGRTLGVSATWRF